VDYVEMPVVLEKLRRTIGGSDFISGLSLFFRDRYFLIATLNDLQSAFESSFKGDLDWFFRPWFGNPFLPNYAIQNAIYDSSSSSLTFNIVDANRQSNVHDYCQQVPVKVYDSSDSIIAQTTVWVNGSATVAIEMAGSPHEIRLDYSDYVLVFLQNPDTKYYSTTQIEVIPTPVLLLGAGVLAAVVTVLLAVYYLKKRRAV
jgi:aminopeptidase N